jgi:hypothetical protein
MNSELGARVLSGFFVLVGVLVVAFLLVSPSDAERERMLKAKQHNAETWMTRNRVDGTATCFERPTCYCDVVPLDARQPFSICCGSENGDPCTYVVK